MKPEHIDVVERTCLKDAGQHEVISQCGLGKPPVGIPSVFCDCFNSMLRIGVVPRDAVVLEEREHLESTFLEAFLVIDRDFRREAPITNGLHKAMNVLFMLVQMPSLQAEFVNRNDNAFQKPAELGSKSLEFCIERIVEQIIINVPDKMCQTLLLPAWQ